jgi:hypothetical protein
MVSCGNLRVQEGLSGQGDNLTTTLMKKLVYLALLSAMAFVVGCNKAEDTSAPAGATNATPAAPSTK